MIMFKETAFNGLVRVQRRTAKRLFEEGKDVFLTPHKLRFDTRFNPPSSIKTLHGKYKFDDIVGDFEYYNCNKDTGKYTSFYARA